MPQTFRTTCIMDFYIYTLFVDYIVRDGSNMATFAPFKDWIDNTVFDEDGDIVREVNVNIVIENSDPAAKLEWPGNIPKCPDCHQLFLQSTFRQNLLMVQWPQLA